MHWTTSLYHWPGTLKQYRLLTSPKLKASQGSCNRKQKYSCDVSPSHKNPSVLPWLFQKAENIVRWDLATLRAFISSYRVGEGRRRHNLVSVSLQQIVAPHWISKGSLVLPLIVNEKNCCGVTVVTKLYVTLMELITQFPCKIPSLVCARITVVSSLRSKKIPCTWADAQSLPHSTFPPVFIKKLEANCLTFELQSFTPMCIWNWTGRNAWSLLWTFTIQLHRDAFW